MVDWACEEGGEVRPELCLEPASRPSGDALRSETTDAAPDGRAHMNERSLFPSKEARGNGKRHPNGFGKEGADCEEPWDVDPIQIGLEFWNATGRIMNG